MDTGGDRMSRKLEESVVAEGAVDEGYPRVESTRQIDPSTLPPEVRARLDDHIERLKLGLEPRGHRLEFEDGKLISHTYNP